MQWVVVISLGWLKWHHFDRRRLRIRWISHTQLFPDVWFCLSSFRRLLNLWQSLIRSSLVGGWFCIQCCFCSERSLKACCKTSCWTCRICVWGCGLSGKTGSDSWDLSEVSGCYLSVSNVLGLVTLDVPGIPQWTLHGCSCGTKSHCVINHHPL